MRSYIKTGWLAVAALSFSLAVSTSEAYAKGKGGGGKGRGGGKAQSTFSGPSGGRSGHVHDGSSSRIRRSPHDHRSGGTPHRAEWSSRENHHWRADQNGGSSHPWSTQRANEDRKLNHRLGVADKLDQLAERTGNTKLHDTAARQREKAHEHYEKRLAKINSKDPNYVPPEEYSDGTEDLLDDSELLDEPLAESPSQYSGAPTHSTPEDNVTSPVDAVERLTGRENALYRQLRNEQRKLAQRMDAAERLWDAYEQTGDETLADAARAMEERALAHFDKRIEAISDFQQRHGLSDQVGQVLQEMEEAAADSEEVSVLVTPIP
jgi:hypothetical protein